MQKSNNTVSNNPVQTRHCLVSNNNLKSNQSNKKSKTLLGFTLVELMIVIVILAILTTIAFLSFSSQSSSARDSVKLSNIANISKGLEALNAISGTYPMPENISGTGKINGTVISYVGRVGDNTARMIKFSETPKDSLGTNNYYMYGVSYNQRFFQIGAVMENPLGYDETLLISKANATSYQTAVKGNYNGLLANGTEICNPPSLLFNGSGNLSSTGANGAFFITNKSTNLPYSPDSSATIANQTPGEVLNLLGASGSNLTVTCTGITDWNTQSGAISATLGYPIDTIGTTYYGTTKYNEILLQSSFQSKINPVVNLTISTTSIASGSLLSSATLSGSFKVSSSDNTLVPGTLVWKTPSIVLTTSGNQDWKFIPSDTATYNIISGIVNVLVIPPIGTTCHSGSSITRTQALINKSTIIDGTGSYYGCNITDYYGVSGVTAIIAGTTVGGNVLVAYPYDEATNILFKTTATTTSGLADNGADSDGSTNTVAMITASGTLHPAANICNSRGAGIWYLPAINELILFYNNLKVKGYNDFSITKYYWSSSPYAVGTVRTQGFSTGSWGITSKTSTANYIRCASRF